MRTIALPLPVDPELRDAFDETPHEDRPQAELDQWWDQPYLVTNGDGSYSCRCLNGGAWDRSTWLAAAPTLEEATRLGLAKQEEFLAFRRTPVVGYVDGDVWDVHVMPQRPGSAPTILATGVTLEDARQTIERHGYQA